MIIAQPIQSLEKLDVSAPLRDLFADPKQWKTVQGKGAVSRFLGKYDGLAKLSNRVYGAEKFIRQTTGLPLTGTQVHAHVTFVANTQNFVLPAIDEKASELTKTLRGDALVTDALWHHVGVKKKIDHDEQSIDLDISMSPRLQRHLRNHYAKQAAFV